MPDVGLLATNDFFRATWETSELAWLAPWTFSDATAGTQVTTGTTGVLYQGAKYGNFATAAVIGDGNNTPKDRSAICGDFTLGSATGYAAFAFRINSINYFNGRANGSPLTVADHIDFLCWPKLLDVSNAELSDGTAPSSAAPFKPVIVKTATAGANAFLSIAHVEGGNLKYQWPAASPFGIGIDYLKGKWLGCEFSVQIRRNPVNTAQNGIRIVWRLYNLETRRPRPLFTDFEIDYPINNAAGLYTAAYSVAQIRLGTNKVKWENSSSTGDNISYDFDDFSGGKDRVPFPRTLYGGEFRANLNVDTYVPVGGAPEFSRLLTIPPERLSSLSLDYREHGFETGLDAEVADPGIVRIENMKVGAAGGSSTSFKVLEYDGTNPTQCTNYYARKGGAWIVFTSGALKGQRSRVTAYNGSTFFVTVATAFTAGPANNDTFNVVWYDNTIDRFKLLVPGQSRVEVIATDHTLRSPATDFFQSGPGNWTAQLDEFGPIWWSGFLDSLAIDERPTSKGYRIRAYGISELLKKVRSPFRFLPNKVPLTYALNYDASFPRSNTTPGAAYAFINWDKCADIKGSSIDTHNAALLFEDYGEMYLDAAESVARMLGSYSVGIEVSPWRIFTSNSDAQDAFFESRDTKDDSGKGDYILRTMHYLSPKIRRLAWNESDGEFANRWLFHGATFQGELILPVTHRAVTDGSKPHGFSSVGWFDATHVDAGVLSEHMNTSTGTALYPSTFAGWEVEILKRWNRVGYYRDSDGKFVYEGGDVQRRSDLSGRRTRFIEAIQTQTNEVFFWTTKTFPGARSSYEDLTTGGWTEGLVVALRPNGRKIQRVIENTKSTAAIGVRLKHIQSADVIGFLQAGIAAQTDLWAQARGRYTAEIVEYPFRERMQISNTRVSVIDNNQQMIRFGTTAGGGDNLKVGARNPTTGDTFAVQKKYKVGYSRLSVMRSVNLKLAPGGWAATWSLASNPQTAADVLSRMGKESQKQTGR